MSSYRPPATPPPRSPDVVRTVAGLREAVAELRAAGRRIAVVPTMGAFHEGHLELMRIAAWSMPNRASTSAVVRPGAYRGIAARRGEMRMLTPTV